MDTNISSSSIVSPPVIHQRKIGKRNAKDIMLGDAARFVLEKFPTTVQIREYFQNKGYSESSARTMVSELYAKIAADVQLSLPTLRENHLAMYQKLIQECRDDKDKEYLIKALARIERICGLESPTNNINIQTNILNNPKALDEAEDWLNKNVNNMISGSMI